MMYWPNINNDIENHIGRCGTCQKHRYKQAKEPMEQHEIPEKPWRRVGTYLFTLFGKNVLVVVDYTSNYPEVAKLEDLSLETTDTVRVRGDGVWSEKAQVLARVAPNSYLVELERGKRLRRNRRHLLKTQERFVPVHDDDDDREKEVYVDHPSGGATASTNQSAVTPEAAQSSHSTDQSQPVSTMSDVRTTRSGRIIKLPSRYVHD